MRLEESLADADRLGRHLDQLVVLDIGDRLLEAHAPGRGEADAFVLGAAGAEVGELLGLQGVDLEVLGLGVLADHHAFVEHLAGRDEEDAALFQHVEGVSDGRALFHRDEDAVLAALDRALVRAVALEQAVHDAGAAGVREELAVIADEAAAGRAERQPGFAAARWAHVGHLALAQRHLVDDGAGEFVVDVDDDGFIRLFTGAYSGRIWGAVAEQDARAADAELEALAAQGLDEHAQLELATARDLEAVMVGADG